MDADLSLLAIFGVKQVFDLGGDFVGVEYTHLRIHHDMRLDDVGDTVFTRFQVVDVFHALHRMRHLDNLFLDIFRQRGFKQFRQGRQRQLDAENDDGDTDATGDDGVKYRPLIS